MPTPEELAEFTAVLADCRTLPTNFTRDVIMKAPSRDIMNSMTRSVLTLANYDDQVNGGLGNSIRQCIRLISEFPMLAVYAYHAYNHYENNDSMYIHLPDPSLSTAENILRMPATTCPTPSWRPRPWTSPSSSTWSTGAATTPPSPPGW